LVEEEKEEEEGGEERKRGGVGEVVVVVAVVPVEALATLRWASGGRHLIVARTTSCPRGFSPFRGAVTEFMVSEGIMPKGLGKRQQCVEK
jgi:hypothetical protein